MKYLIACITFILGATITGFYFHFQIDDLKEKHLAAQDQVIIYKRNQDLYNILIVQYGKEIVRNNFLEKTSLASPAGDTISFNQLLQTGTKLIYRFNESQCSSCYSSQFKKLMDLEKKIGKEAIVLLVSFDDNNSLNALKETYKLELPIYNTSSLAWKDMPLEKLNQPYMFLMNTSNCMNFFLPDKSLQKMTDQYFEQVIDKIQ